MERIDKIISSQTEYSRKEVKKLVSDGRVKVDNEVVNKSDLKIDINSSKIFIDDINIKIKEKIYLALNKPEGYLSATKDQNTLTIIDLIPKEYKHRELFPVGRLDKDTTGLIIVTDDGEFSHDIISPKKHIKKVYSVLIDKEINIEMINGFKEGVELNDGKCRPSILEKTGLNTALVTITEGRYHQIKRMFGCFGAKVLKLKRVKIGNYILPNDLEEGKFRELDDCDLMKIKELV